MHHPAPSFVGDHTVMSSPRLVHVHEKLRGHVEMRGACMSAPSVVVPTQVHVANLHACVV